MAMDSREFAHQVIRHAEEMGETLKAKVYTNFEPLSKERTIQQLKTQMFREYWLGVIPPSKQLIGLPDTEVELKVLITRQLCEEFLHYRVFAQRVNELGDNGNLADYEPFPEDLAMRTVTNDYEEPWELAAALQIYGEIILITTYKWMMEVVDAKTAALIRDQVLVHEGSHIRNGRLILEKFATTDEIQRRVQEIGERKFRQILKSYGTEMHKVYASAKS